MMSRNSFSFQCALTRTRRDDASSDIMAVMHKCNQYEMSSILPALDCCPQHAGNHGLIQLADGWCQFLIGVYPWDTNQIKNLHFGSSFRLCNLKLPCGISHPPACCVTYSSWTNVRSKEGKREREP